MKTAVACPRAEQIRELVSRVENGVAFQSVVVAALQTLGRVRERLEKALLAAISLAHGESLEEMIAEIDGAIAAVSDAVNAQGRCMLDISPGSSIESEQERSWWFALSETIHSIDDGAKRMVSLASGQPKGGPARQLISHVVRLLRCQHRRLLTEADAWIS